MQKLYSQRIIFIVFLCILFVTSSSIAFADYSAFKDGTENPGAMTKVIMGWIDDIMGTETLESVNAMVTVSFDFEEDTMEIGGITITGISKAVKGVNDLMILAATMIAVICFLISLERKFLHQQYTHETLILQLIILSIALVCIGESLWICQQLSNFGSGMATAVINRIQTTTNTPVSVENIKALIYADCEKVATGGVMNKITTSFTNISSQMGYIVQLLIPWIIMKIVSVVISFICWGRAIEILILSSLSPVAFADILSDKGHSAGEKFIRNFLALSLQGVVIIIAMYFCSQIHLGIISTNFSDTNMTVDMFAKNIYKIIVIGLVEVGLVTKSISITKEVIGLI